MILKPDVLLLQYTSSLLENTPETKLKSIAGSCYDPESKLERIQPQMPLNSNQLGKIGQDFFESTSDIPPLIPPKSKSRKLELLQHDKPPDDNSSRHQTYSTAPPEPLRLKYHDFSREIVSLTSQSSPGDQICSELPVSFSPVNPPIPEEKVALVPEGYNILHAARRPLSQSIPSQSSHRLSVDSIVTSVFDAKSSVDLIPKRLSSLSTHNTLDSSPVFTISSVNSDIPYISTVDDKSDIHTFCDMSSPIQSIPRSKSIFKVLPEIEDGLIPADEDLVFSDQITRKPDTSIGPESSFYQHKGFCEGAKEVQRGNLGVKRAKRRVCYFY